MTTDVVESNLIFLVEKNIFVIHERAVHEDYILVQFMPKRKALHQCYQEEFTVDTQTGKPPPLKTSKSIAVTLVLIEFSLN